MKVLKKILAFALTGCLFLTVGVTVACGHTGESGGSSENVVRVGVYNTAKEKTAIQAVIDSFKSENSDYLTQMGVENIELKEIPAGEYQTKIQGMARTGTLPDVFMTIDTLAPKFASQTVSLNLTPYVEQNDEYKALLADMYESMYEQGVFNGELHMIAREYSRNVIYYNKTLLSEAGLEAPENDWKWEDFVKYTEKLIKTENGKVVQNGAELTLNWPSNIMPVIYGLGGQIFDESGNGAVTDATEQAYAQLKVLVDSGAVCNTFSGTGTSFSNKTVAMMSGTRASVSDVLSYFGKDSTEWGVVCFPDMRDENGNKPYIGAGTSGYSVSAKSANKEVAVKFLMYLISENGQKALASTGNFVPVRKSMAEDTCWTSDLDIGLPADFNHEAFTYNDEYDLDAFSVMIKDASKQMEFLTQMNLMTEYYLKYGTNVSSLGYTDVSGWKSYWNTQLNTVFA